MTEIPIPREAKPVYPLGTVITASGPDRQVMLVRHNPGASRPCKPGAPLRWKNKDRFVVEEIRYGEGGCVAGHPDNNAEPLRPDYCFWMLLPDSVDWSTHKSRRHRTEPLQALIDAIDKAHFHISHGFIPGEQYRDLQYLLRVARRVDVELCEACEGTGKTDNDNECAECIDTMGLMAIEPRSENEG